MIDCLGSFMRELGKDGDREYNNTVLACLCGNWARMEIENIILSWLVYAGIGQEQE